MQTSGSVMKRRDGWIGTVRVLGLLMALTLVACGTDGDETREQVAPEVERQAGPTQISDSPPANEAGPSVEAISGLWQEGAHASTFVLDEQDQNSTCARCHAPVNWLPSMDDMPESCMACKFEVDPPPPVIPEGEWTHVECKVCHKYKKDVLQPEAVWLEIAAIEEYIEVASVTELCDKCHLAGGLEAHASIRVAGDHAGYDCTDCHDAHSTQASCGGVDCHPTQMDGSEGIVGHDADHASVSCSACHDAAGMSVGPAVESGLWLTYLPETEIAMTSHETQRSVDCSRCHFAGNTWGLSTATSP